MATIKSNSTAGISAKAAKVLKAVQALPEADRFLFDVAYCTMRSQAYAELRRHHDHAMTQLEQQAWPGLHILRLKKAGLTYAQMCALADPTFETMSREDRQLAKKAMEQRWRRAKDDHQAGKFAMPIATREIDPPLRDS